jgi:hypothetical protein
MCGRVDRELLRERRNRVLRRIGYIVKTVSVALGMSNSIRLRWVRSRRLTAAVERRPRFRMTAGRRAATKFCLRIFIVEDLDAIIASC